MGLESMIGKNENILWRGKPDKKCFILEGIFNPMLPFAVIWLVIDLFVMGQMIPESGGMGLFVAGFFLLHMIPVWIYLFGVFAVFLKYKHTEYVVTDKAIYTTGGIISVQFNTKPFAEMSRVNIHRGIFDQLIGVGDVLIGSEMATNYYTSNSSSFAGAFGIKIEDIREYEYVFKMIKELQEDVYSDTMYPNALRPEENFGYRTQYRGRGKF